MKGMIQMNSKRFLGNVVLVSLASLALLPSLAFASPELTYPKGTKMPINSKVRTTAVGTTTFTVGGLKLACTVVELDGTVLTNSGTRFEINIENAVINGSATKTDCTSGTTEVRITTNPGTNGLPWCLWSVAGFGDEALISGGKCAPTTQPLRLVLDYTGLMECPYEIANSITAKFATSPGDALFTISEAPFSSKGGPMTCPTTMKLDGEFTLEKQEVGVNPVYID